MKDKFLLLTFTLWIVVFSTFSQTFQGQKADRIIRDSKVVRMQDGSSVPTYIQLREAAHFPVSEFSGWAKKAFKLRDGIEFLFIRKEVGNLGIQHFRYEITNNGIPVFGAFIYSHVTSGLVSSINGKLPVEVIARQPVITESSALENAKMYVGATSYKWVMQGEEDHLKWETKDENATYFPKGELVYIDPNFEFAEASAFHLAYKFDIYSHAPLYRAEVFVDAQTGNVLFENHRIHIADVVGTAQTGYSGTRSIVADSFNGSFRLREAGRGNGIRTFNMNTGTDYGNAVDFTDNDNNWNNANANLDQYATDAHWGAEMAFDYYFTKFGRNSIDDNNMVINSYVHYDNGFFNAFWDGQRMTYGDGNGLPLTTVDICGHEIAHGVNNFSANLIYQDEYGALSESFSDIFGAALEWFATPELGDWLIGEDVGTFRSMSNPPDYGDPDTYTGISWFTGTGDNGGVHVNSGVQNKWFYILVEGETGINDLADAYNVTGIGLDAAEAIAYRSLTVYLGPTSEYVDARFYSIQAAADLFGGCSDEVIACTNAWYAVGVGNEFDASVNSNFSASLTSSCQAPFEVDFTNLSNNGASYFWNFGDGETSTSVNPDHVYSSNGTYTVTLIADGDNCGMDTLILADLISANPNNPCTFLMPDNGSQTLTSCTGTLYDDGGPNNNYQDNNNVITTISPDGATSVTLNFSSFGFEATYDYLFIYDGPSTASPLIGQYDGFNLPNGGTIISSGASITLRQNSDPYVTESGFALTWECAQTNAAPSPNFMATPRVSCTGNISFTDMSINGATEWLWDFGDGNTSTDQNPTHTYFSSGNYTVVLTATNNFGSNIVSQNNYIQIDRPQGPNAVGNARCYTGSVALSAVGDGTLQWYGQPTGGTPIGTGTVFNTPNISNTTAYYVEDVVSAVGYNVGPTDNAFGGGGNFAGTQHLVFDCIAEFTLQTVKVYAQGSGNRTIELRDNTGTVLQSITINIADGQQVVTLDFNVPPGNNYQLGATAGADLYRNNSGPNYPYEIADIVSIQTSSAGTDYYYSFYDWQIEIAGCTSERTEVVATINSDPMVSLSADTAICEAEIVQITSTATDADSYLWSPNGETTTDISISPTTQTTYSVTVFNTCGNATDSSTITVNPLPIVSAPADEEICLGDTAQLTANGNGTFSWQPNGEVGNSINVNPTESTIYTVTSTNMCGSVSEDVLIVVNPLPLVNAGSNEEICVGESTLLVATGAENYVWNTFETLDSISVNPTQTATFSVVGTDANNCFATDSVTVIVNSLPSADTGT
ncbi:MAG: M4 family metallopeptidase, partial [Flavobacteriales bacterium]|nr:M4 family metallopeptidase [Flavobacteriales bacterium]